MFPELFSQETNFVLLRFTFFENLEPKNNQTNPKIIKLEIEYYSRLFFKLFFCFSGNPKSFVMTHFSEKTKM